MNSSKRENELFPELNLDESEFPEFSEVEIQKIQENIDPLDLIPQAIPTPTSELSEFKTGSGELTQSDLENFEKLYANNLFEFDGNNVQEDILGFSTYNPVPATVPQNNPYDLDIDLTFRNNNKALEEKYSKIKAKIKVDPTKKELTIDADQIEEKQPAIRITWLRRIYDRIRKRVIGLPDAPKLSSRDGIFYISVNDAFPIADRNAVENLINFLIATDPKDSFEIENDTIHSLTGTKRSINADVQSNANESISTSVNSMFYNLTNANPGNIEAAPIISNVPCVFNFTKPKIQITGFISQNGETYEIKFPKGDNDGYYHNALRVKLFDKKRQLNYMQVSKPEKDGSFCVSLQGIQPENGIQSIQKALTLMVDNELRATIKQEISKTLFKDNSISNSNSNSGSNSNAERPTKILRQ